MTPQQACVLMEGDNVSIFLEQDRNTEWSAVRQMLWSLTHSCSSTTMFSLWFIQAVQIWPCKGCYVVTSAQLLNATVLSTPGNLST